MSKWSTMARLSRPVTTMIWSMPEATASSTPYWMMGLSTTGSISLGWALVAGRNRVPRPAAGKTAFRLLLIHTSLAEGRVAVQELEDIIPDLGGLGAGEQADTVSRSGHDVERAVGAGAVVQGLRAHLVIIVQLRGDEERGHLEGNAGGVQAPKDDRRRQGDHAIDLALAGDNHRRGAAHAGPHQGQPPGMLVSNVPHRGGQVVADEIDLLLAVRLAIPAKVKGEHVVAAPGQLPGEREPGRLVIGKHVAQDDPGIARAEQVAAQG